MLSCVHMTHAALPCHPFTHCAILHTCWFMKFSLLGLKSLNSPGGAKEHSSSEGWLVLHGATLRQLAHVSVLLLPACSLGACCSPLRSSSISVSPPCLLAYACSLRSEIFPLPSCKGAHPSSKAASQPPSELKLTQLLLGHAEHSTPAAQQPLQMIPCPKPKVQHTRWHCAVWLQLFTPPR